MALPLKKIGRKLLRSVGLDEYAATDDGRTHVPLRLMRCPSLPERAGHCARRSV
jgi:hypothetical protein